jgi:hypothetical protein
MTCVRLLDACRLGHARHDPLADADVPTAPEGYAQYCGKVARAQVGKAALRLADQIKKLFP